MTRILLASMVDCKQKLLGVAWLLATSHSRASDALHAIFAHRSGGVPFARALSPVRHGCADRVRGRFS
jgi:hypothetical protein